MSATPAPLDLQRGGIPLRPASLVKEGDTSKHWQVHRVKIAMLEHLPIYQN